MIRTGIVSFQSKTSEPNYDRYISLNEYALVSIMRHLESATNLLVEGELSAAVSNLNYAWTISPEGVRKKMKQSPSIMIKERIKNQVPSAEEIKKHRQWLDSISEDAVTIHSTDEGQFLDEEGLRAKLYQESKIAEIVEGVLSELQLDVVQALEENGLYITKGGRKVIPTYELEPEKPLPTLNKLPASLPRG